MNALNDTLATLFLIGGLFFMFLGVLGIVRLPDAYHRLHAATKCSTLGLLGLVLAVMFHLGTPAVITKGILVIVFTFAANPVGSHLLAKAAHRDGAPLWEGTLDDELKDEQEDEEATASA